MRKNTVRAVSFLTVGLVGLATAGGEAVIDTRFYGSSRPWKTVRGQASTVPLGLRIEADSRVDFDLEAVKGEGSGTIIVSFISPTLDAASLGPLETGSECYCAFKVRSGRVEVEVSERWLRVQRYDKHITRIERILTSVDRAVHPDSEERTLTIAVECGRMRVRFDEDELVAVDDVPADLGDLHLATYGHAFTVTHLRVEARHADPLTVDRDAGVVEVAARFHRERFNHGPGLKEHHFIVWEEGKAAENALFTTSVSDSAIHEALVRAGGKPGNNLTQETWSERRNARSSEPDKHVQGTPVAIEVAFCDTVLTADEVLRDSNGRPMDFRFGGNRAFIPLWRSGCVTCLQSCPGGKTGNRTYTIRDLVNDRPHFTITQELPFVSEERVIIRFKLKK